MEAYHKTQEPETPHGVPAGEPRLMCVFVMPSIAPPSRGRNTWAKRRDSFKLVGRILTVATAGGSSPRLHLRSTLKGAAPPAPGTVAAAVGGAGSRLQPAWLV